jgi:secreted Zn-dependent insulinase-like peptidase
MAATAEHGKRRAFPAVVRSKVNWRVLKCELNFDSKPRSNYAFKPIAEQALRPIQTIVPQRLNAALAFI